MCYLCVDFGSKIEGTIVWSVGLCEGSFVLSARRGLVDGWGGGGGGDVRVLGKGFGFKVVPGNKPYGYTSLSDLKPL